MGALLIVLAHPAIQIDLVPLASEAFRLAFPAPRVHWQTPAIPVQLSTKVRRLTGLVPPKEKEHEATSYGNQDPANRN